MTPDLYAEYASQVVIVDGDHAEPLYSPADHALMWQEIEARLSNARAFVLHGDRTGQALVIEPDAHRWTNLLQR